VVIASPFRGTRDHDCCQVKARQPVFRNRTAAKNRDKDLLTRHRCRETPNLQNHSPRFSPPKTTRPRSAAADRGLVESPCGELPVCRSPKMRELTHQNVRFACITQRARGDASLIRQNQRLAQRGERRAGKRFAVVRMHRGAHSRLESAGVKRKVVVVRVLERAYPRRDEIRFSPGPSLWNLAGSRAAATRNDIFVKVSFRVSEESV
jgi:hypothetical protein